MAGQRSTTGIKILKTKTTDMHKFYISAKQEISGAKDDDSYFVIYPPLHSIAVLTVTNTITRL